MLNSTRTLLCCGVLALFSSACSSDGTSKTQEPADGANSALDGGKVAQNAPDARSSSTSNTPPARSDAGVTHDAVGNNDAGGSEPSDARVATVDAALPSASVFPSVTDPKADGPYKTKTIENTGPNSNYTIYQPDPLGPDGIKHPVLTWGNGGSTSPAWYSMLPHLASHGFVVVAANTIPAIGAEVALGMDMVTGMDWILQQNQTSGSDYYGKLDSVRIAPFGYSMGGLATFTIVGDPRWLTTVHLSGGNMGEGPARIAKAHAPMFWECGTTDIAGANCDTDFSGLTTQSVFYGTLNGVDHLGILEPDAGAVISGAVTAWFRYYLMDDQTFKPTFFGADCTLCKDTTTWKVQKKNFD